MAALCDYAGGGCSVDAAGEYDVVLPEPPHVDDDGNGEGQFKISVTMAGATSCSAAFSLVSSTDAPQSGDHGGPFLEVISPMEGDGAVAGEDYTVEVCRRRFPAVQSN